MMFQAPNIGEMILHHTSDAHEIEFEWPWGGHSTIHLPQWEPVHLGPLTLDLSPTKHVVFMLVAAVLVWATMYLAGRALERRRAAGRAPGGLPGLIEAMVLFVRNDIAIANIGHHRGASFAPYIMTLFFFILYSNLLGLLPWGATPTGNLAVTAGLALTAFATIEISGMRALGPKGYMHTIVFTPPGVSGFMAVVLTLIMIPVELIGKLVKPFALCLRLFANMTAGHFVILALLGMIFLFGSAMWAIKGTVVAGAVGFSLFMYMLELFVAFLQAYIFALLTSVFIGLMQHEH
ncbi:MAG TPA: F0F1 ATP synthase subunit A [Gemmatimonadales bacterium]|nr:F0F1 ATP synthase subunit A [Gemmatimonadales bacterium]